MLVHSRNQSKKNISTISLAHDTSPVTLTRAHQYIDSFPKTYQLTSNRSSTAQLISVDYDATAHYVTTHQSNVGFGSKPI